MVAGVPAGSKAGRGRRAVSPCAVGGAGERVAADLVEVAGVGEAQVGAGERVVDAGAAGAAVAGVVAPVAFRLGEREAVGGEAREQPSPQARVSVCGSQRKSPRNITWRSRAARAMSSTWCQ